MRFLKDEILSMKEIICDGTNIFDLLADISHGSDIYCITNKQYDTLKELKGIKLVRALKGEMYSQFENKKIGLFNKYLVGSPLVLFDKPDSSSTRSFSFLFQNYDAGVEENECEVIDNYPPICNTRDIVKYHTDNALYTDTPLEEIITCLINNSKKFYHITNYGYLMSTTPRQYEEREDSVIRITNGKIPIRRKQISKVQTLTMLDEMVASDGDFSSM